MEGLLSRCAQGDARAWDRLLGEVRRLVLELGRWRYSLGREDAEDVAQVVQLRVAQRLPQLRQAGAFPVWVRRLAHHAMIDHLRQHRALVSLDELAATSPELELEPAAADEYEQVLLRADLDDALARLPDHYREPIRMHVLLGLPQDEVARLLGRPRSTVASQVERGLRRLQRVLSPTVALHC